jgi:hypothetical protein
MITHRIADDGFFKGSRAAYLARSDSMIDISDAFFGFL